MRNLVSTMVSVFRRQLTPPANLLVTQSHWSTTSTMTTKKASTQTCTIPLLSIHLCPSSLSYLMMLILQARGYIMTYILLGWAQGKKVSW